MKIIHQHDKRSGITYAYESKSWWDKEKQQSRAKRRLIGRVDPSTGEIVPTDGRNRRKKKTEVAKRGAPRNEISKRYFYGATYLFDEISNKLGITEDLKACFPKRYKEILSVAYFLILEDRNPLSRFEKWHHLHKHPNKKLITSQRSSELFASIDEKSKLDFFRRQSKRRSENEYWAYDITSISSYSKNLKMVQYGHNKERDDLAQINLAMVYGEESGLPFYYRHLAGNIPDVKTLRHLLSDFNHLDFKFVKCVMDRGFYSRSNVNDLMKEHLKFLMSTKMSLKWVREALDPIYDEFRNFESYDEDYDLYMRTVKTTWDYEQIRPYKGDVLTSKKRIYVHYYFNIDRAAEDEKNFHKQLKRWQNEIETNKRKLANEKRYQQYFIVTETPKRGVKAQVKQDAVDERKRYYGFFALISNDTMEAKRALELYRTKDVVEKGFNNLKEKLNLRRLLVSSEQSLEGKLFAQFVALIFISYINKQMQINKLYQDYTLSGLLDKLDLIEAFEREGQKLEVGEILTEQTQIYERLGIDPPTSL